jgi:hypothetical protein
MIEAMACGTPVLAFKHGSVPEVIEDGLTGYVVDSLEDAVCKIGALLALDRGRVRRRFEQRFSAERMARDYVRIYAKLIAADADHKRPNPTLFDPERDEIPQAWNGASASPVRIRSLDADQQLMKYEPSNKASWEESKVGASPDGEAEPAPRMTRIVEDRIATTPCKGETVDRNTAPNG